MSKLLQIQQHPGFVKDTESGAILNTDNDKLTAYKKQKKLMRAVATNEQRIEQLESDIHEMKGMLQLLVSKMTGND
jgi:TolA-binding protein